LSQSKEESKFRTLLILNEVEYTLKMLLKIQDVQLPIKAYENNIGFDLYATEDEIIGARKCLIINTEIAIEIPKGTYCCLAPRSSLITKEIEVKAGVLDQGFTGIIKVLLANENLKRQYRINKGDKIT
jgi:dUTP pyrophosphatase